jgi:hypothetical protein
MFFVLATGLFLAVWINWAKDRRKWDIPHWRSLLTVVSLLGLSFSFGIYFWAIGGRKHDQLIGGVLMGMRPWPLVAACCALAAIVAAVVGRKGTRILVVLAALLLELSVYVAVMTD